MNTEYTMQEREFNDKPTRVYKHVEVQHVNFAKDKPFKITISAGEFKGFTADVRDYAFIPASPAGRDYPAEPASVIIRAVKFGAVDGAMIDLTEQAITEMLDNYEIMSQIVFEAAKLWELRNV